MVRKVVSIFDVKRVDRLVLWLFYILAGGRVVFLKSLTFRAKCGNISS